MINISHPHSLEYAQALDQQDPLKVFREAFTLPEHRPNEPFIYFCGNSLGCQPKKSSLYLQEEMDRWAQIGVEAHFRGDRPWTVYQDFLAAPMAQIVGAHPDEVVLMNTLTVNLHLMLVSFFRPEGKRNKILIEADAFPSDIYALESQLHWHGLDPETCLLKLSPREGEHLLRQADIEALITEEQDHLALVLLGGLNYYTGQVYDMQAITAHAHQYGITVGFDLAHAAGNIPLALHDWGVDFAVWCTYKYINSGPGGPSGAFVHRKYAHRSDLPRFAGWWGHDKAERFEMKPSFKPIPGAEGWQLSNAPILSFAPLRASLELFDRIGMPALRTKSEALTGYLETLLQPALETGRLSIITPKNPQERGAQLSLLTHTNGKALFDSLEAQGVICDWREPNVIRVAPVPLYNSFEEVWRFAQIIGL